MGKFKTACPNCHTELEVCGEWSGCQAYCPTCNSLITIPFPSEEPEEGRMVVCPECGLTQKIPLDGAKHLYNCRACGAPFAAASSMIFRIAKKLPPDEPGMLKIACPYCGYATLAIGEDRSETCAESKWTLRIGGGNVDIAAYNMGGNNYFQLKQLGEVLGFGVDYDLATRTMLVTSK